MKNETEHIHQTTINISDPINQSLNLQFNKFYQSFIKHSYNHASIHILFFCANITKEKMFY